MHVAKSNPCFTGVQCQQTKVPAKTLGGNHGISGALVSHWRFCHTDSPGQKTYAAFSRSMLLLLGNFCIVCTAVKKKNKKKPSVVAYFCDCSFPSCLTDECSIGEELKWRELFSLWVINCHGNNYPTKTEQSQSNKRQYPVEVWLRTFGLFILQSQSLVLGGS